MANRLRTLLTLLGIVIGITSVIALTSILGGLQSLVVGELQSLGDRLLLIRPGTPQSAGKGTTAGHTPVLTLQDAFGLAGLPSVAAVAPSLSLGGAQLSVGSRVWMTQVTAVNESFAVVRHVRMGTGTWITRQQDQVQAPVIVLGSDVAKQLFQYRDPMGKVVHLILRDGTNLPLRVTGVEQVKKGLVNSNNDEAFVPLSTLLARIGQRTPEGQQIVSDIDMQATSDASIDQAKREATNLLLRHHRVTAEDFTIDDVRSFLQGLDTFARGLSIIVGIVAGISLVVGGIGVMNIMLVSVTERTREIGIRRAVGARRHDVLMQFLTESVVVSVLGGIIGLTLGALVVFCVSLIDVQGQHLPPTVGVGATVLAVSVSAFIGIAFGSYPAIRASRLKPIEALRYE
jgi:putative ABC transport system permease protein